MASLTGPVYVPAPNPIVPRYGLFQVATGPLDLPENARQGGIQYQTATCTLPSAYEVACQADRDEKTIDMGVPTVSGAPFIVYSAIECSPVGLANWGEDYVKKQLYDRLVAGEQATVENVFSQSLVGQFPGLAGNPDVVNLGNASSLTQGVGMLESWLYARYGLIGVIHAPMYAAPFFLNAYLIERDRPGTTWYTSALTEVSIGNYANLGPSGQVPASGDVWLYITGQVAIYRTPDSQVLLPRPIGQLLNQTTNVMTLVMEREYVLTFDCYVAAVQVQLGVGS